MLLEALTNRHLFIGEGGFGTVLRAQRGGELYALKLLPLEEVGEWAMRELLNLADVLGRSWLQARLQGRIAVLACGSWDQA